MRTAVVIVAAIVILIVAWRRMNARSVPQAGTVAPDFSLPSQDGSLVNLKDFRGKWVVLYFYPKDFTYGCTIEAHNFQRDQSEYAKRDAVVLGVSMDSADSHKQFCAKEGLNFKLLADKGQVSKDFGSLMNFGVVRLATRHTFVIDPQGKIARSYTSVAPSRHSPEVLAALDELQGASRKQ